MSDSVANLTVKVDTKSVSAAVQALDKLAAVAAKVEKSVGNIGAASAKQSQSAQSLEKWASKSESAFAKMEKRLESGAKKYEQITHLVNRHALSEDVRARTMDRVNRAFEHYNRVASNVNASTLQIDRAARSYNQTIGQTKAGIDSVMRLERQRATETKKNAADTARAAKEAMQGSRAVFRQAGGYQSLIDQQLGLTPQQSNVRNAELAKLRSQIERSLTPATGAVLRQAGGYQSLIDRLTSGGTGRQNDLASFYADQEKKATAQIDKSARALQAKLQQAQGAAQGIILRAGRQLSPETGVGITRQAEVALARYTSALNTHGVKSLEADRAADAFKTTMRGLSSEIARVGGLLPRLNDNARTISAAFGAANASVGGFSRAIFNTSAAISALTGAFALREITQSIMEFERFTNTLQTVSNSSNEFSKNLNFLFGEANRIGFAVGEVGNSFARLSLAMQSSGFNANESRQAFSQLAEASRNFGLSSADTMGVIRALEQSMSKGKFMAEEVRLQMGDRLPVAMAALERAVTKVDGKQSDLNKRFEEGTIDTRRYALEFVRQINALSGGADALSRTSNSIAAAFGRLNTEFVLTTKAFGEGGFTNAVIILTQNLISLFQTLREIGVITAAGAAMEFLAKQTTLLTAAFLALSAALATSLLAWAVKAVAVLSPLARIVAAIAAGIGLLVGALDAMSSSQRLVNQLTASTNNLNSAHKEGIAIADGFTNAIRNSTTAVDSSTSPLEKRIQFLRQIGVNEMDVTRIVAEEEGKRLQIKLNAARAEMASIQNVYSTMREREVGFSNAISLSITESIAKRLEDAKRGNTSLTEDQKKTLKEFATTWDTIRKEVVSGSKMSQDAYTEFAKAAKAAGMESNESVRDVLTNLLKLAEAEQPLRNQEALILALEKAMKSLRLAAEDPLTFRVNIQTEFPGEDPNLARAVTSGIDYTKYVPAKDAQDRAAGEKVLQAAYKAIMKDTRAVADSEQFLIRVRDDAKAGIVGAQKILDDYNAALAKNDTKITGTEKSLRKYTETLQIELDTHQGLLEAYKQSTLAGDDMEVQIKAQTKALDYGTKGSIEYKNALAAILPLMRQRSDQEKDTEAVKANTKQREQEISLLEKERSLIGMNINLREQELAAFRARQQNEGRAPDVILAAEDQARKIVRIRQETDQLDNSYKEMANIGVRAFEQVGDAITEAFAKGEIRALNFGNVIRGVMSSIVQSILRLGIVNPIINSIFSGTMLPTLGLGLSVMGGGGAAAAGAAGAAAGGGGGLGSLLGLGSLTSLLPGGSVGGMFSGASNYLFGTAPSTTMIPGLLEPGIASGYGGMTTAGTPGLFGTAGSASLGGVLGAGGLGFGAGMFTNSLLGGNQTGGMVGSALGTGAGIAAALALDLALPGVGTVLALLGGAAGGGIGGLFGPKPSSKGFSYALRSQDGQLAMTDTYYNEQGRAQFEEANAKIPAINAYLKQRGLTVSGVRAVGGNKYGMGNLGYGEAASFNEALGSLKFAATANEELNKALSTRSFAGPEKLQEFVDGFIALQDTIKGLTADPVPEFKKQMDALIDSFAQATAKAREYGIGEEELLAARDKQIAKLEEQRSLTIRDTALEMHVRRLMAEGMDQEAQRIELAYKTQKEIESFTASLDALGISAEEKSRLLVELERTQAAERVKILKDANKNIRDYLDSLRTSSPLSGTTTMGRLGAAQELFNRDLAAAQTGNVDALNRITQSADTLLNLAREAYASTGGFHDIRGRVVSGLESLATTPMSQQSLPDLASVPLVAEMTNLRTNAAIAETAEYMKRFDSKLAELLPIAEAIQAAVEQANQNPSTSSGSVGFGDYTGPDSNSSGSFGGSMESHGSMAAAMGAVMKHGRVMAYANGGIPDYVNSPTLAPMALFGEAGPEAIMPLRRGPDGRLGVEVNGSDNRAVVSELRAVRDEIVSLREATVDSDGNESTGLVEAIAELRVQVGGLREELRTARLRAQ